MSDVIACDPAVKNIRIEIRSVRPDDRAGLRIHTDLSEPCGIPHRREYAFESHQSADINYAFHSVFETQIKAIITNGSHSYNIFQHSFLLKGIDGFELSLGSREAPILQ